MSTIQSAVEILPDMTPQKNGAILDRVVDGETVLCNLSTNKLLSLNATAGFIWQHCTGSNTVNRLGELLSQSFAVTVEQAQVDLQPLLAGMHRAGLIEL